MGAKKRTSRQGVTMEEVNYTITKLRDLRNDLKANRQHLKRLMIAINMIEQRLCELEETVEGFDVKDVVVVDEEAEG
ncbi:hypothetical protein ES702_03295 [subsurface metagenome]